MRGFMLVAALLQIAIVVALLGAVIFISFGLAGIH